MNQIDLSLLQFINDSHSLFLDGVILTLTSGLTWIPLYISLLFLVIRNNETMKQIIVVIGCALLCVAFTASITDLFVKPFVCRFRPSQDPLTKYAIDIVNGMRDSDYGFFSAHAANTFGIALYMLCVVRSKVFTVTMLFWSFLNCYTRMYLGLHYPGDILAGLAFGAIVGACAYMLYLRLYLNVSPRFNYVSSQYTSTGYSRADIDIVVLVVVLTMLYAIFRSLLM